MVFTVPVIPEGGAVELVFEVDIEGIGIGTVVPTDADVVFDSQPGDGDNDIQRTGDPADDGGDVGAELLCEKSFSRSSAGSGGRKRKRKKKD